MTVLVVSLLLILTIAVLVLIAVAFPYRGRSSDRAPWLTDALGRLLGKVRPDVPNPDYALLSDPDRDARMRERVERVEDGIVGGVRRVTGRHPS